MRTVTLDQPVELFVKAIPLWNEARLKKMNWGSKTVFWVLFLVPSLAGQVVPGVVSGVVLDPSGRSIAGALVEATDESRGVVFRARTDSAGFYQLSHLEPAGYRMSASAASFETVSVTSVRVTVNSKRRLDFRLPLLGRKEVVEVQAPPQAVDSQSAELGLSLDRDSIARLPLNQRDFLQLALLTPGVNPPVEDSELSQRGSFAMHAGGAREEFNNFLLDGVDNNDPDVNRFVVQPSVDAIQEFKIVTNSYSAEYGRSGGGQVNVITRSGANEFHGYAFEYLRNRILDARNFFDAAENSKFVRNQFGFGLGGPVARNRLFFFANAEFLRERRGLSRLASVPDAAERAGDFSQLDRAIVDPFTQAPFPGGRIPESRIDPVARRIAALFPLPNRPGRSGNHLGQPVFSGDSSTGNARLDYQATGRDRLSFRYSHGVSDLFEPYAEDTAATPGFGDTVHDPGRNIMAHHERIISASAVNSFRFGLARFSREILTENDAAGAASYLGVNWLDAAARGFPAFNVAGYSRVGDITSLPIVRDSDTYHATEALSLSRGRHLVKLGGEIRHMEHDGTLDLLTRGSLSFSGQISRSGMSDLLLGLPSFTLRAQADNPQALRSTAYNVFIQDDWKVRPDLTLNLGLRHEYNTPATDPGDRMYTLDPSTGGLAQVGTGSIPRAGYRASGTRFGPRFGVAWSPSSDTVARAGYGVYHDSGMLVVSTAQYFNPPLFNLRVFFPTLTSLLKLSDPFPAGGGMAPPAALNLLDSSLTGAYLQHWSFNVQRSVGGLGVFSVAYAGSKGTHLIRSRDVNQPRPAPGPVQARRPDPRYGNILLIESGSSSSFHSLQASFSRQLSARLAVHGAYTFSKSIDDTSAFLSTKADKNFPQDSLDFRSERGLSSFDVTHRFVSSQVWELPGRHWLTRGFEVRGIVVAQSGQPFTPRLRFDNSNTGNTGGNFGSDRPNLLHDPRLAEGTPDAWFDTGAFAAAPKYSFGSAGRNIVRGSGYLGWFSRPRRRLSTS